MLFILEIHSDTQTLLKTIFLMDAISEVQYYFDFLEKPIGKLTLLDAYRISIKSTDEETTYLSYQSKDLDKINNLKDQILEGIKKKTHEYKMLQQLSMVV